MLLLGGAVHHRVDLADQLFTTQCALESPYCYMLVLYVLTQSVALLDGVNTKLS